MGILIRKEEGIVLTGIARLAIVGMIVSLSVSLTNTIWAVYLDSFVHSIVYVGFISALLTLVSFASYFLFIPLIEKSSKSKIYSFTMLFFVIAYILFALNTKFYFLMILAFFITILHTLRITSYGIIVRDKSKKSQLSRSEGLVYTFRNVAWVIGPLIAGFIAAKSGIPLVFILAAIFVFTAFLVFKVSKIKDSNIKKKVDYNLFKNLKGFLKSKNRIFAYVLRGGVSLWWILIYLFMPLYIIRNGLGTEYIGYFLFAIALPLILIQYKTSKLAERVGFKKIFRVGYLIPFFFVLLCFFMQNVFLILLFLVLASFGLALLEPTTEAYFFDILKKDEECRFYGPYNTSIEISFFIGKVASSVVLLFLPFKFVFLLYAVFMFSLFLLTFRIKDIIERKKR